MRKFFYFLTFIAGLLADRITKSLAFKFLYSKDINVFPGFNLVLSYNRGVSFGMLHSNSPAHFYLLTSVIIAVLVIFFIYTINEYKRGVNLVPETLVLAGGISNIIDRFLYGGVIDFIDLYVYDYHWHTFNVADILIVVGIICILHRSFLDARTRES